MCGLTKKQCAEAHKIFNLRRVSCQFCNLRTYLKKAQYSVPDNVIKLRHSKSLGDLLKFPENVLRVPKHRCPILEIDFFAPCRRTACVFWVNSVRALNCLVRYAQAFPSPTAQALAEILGTNRRTVEQNKKQLLHTLRLKFFEYYVRKDYDLLKNQRLCYFCYSTKGTLLRSSSGFFYCPSCQPFKKTKAVKKLEEKYGLPGGILVKYATEIFGEHLAPTILGLSHDVYEAIHNKVRGG